MEKILIVEDSLVQASQLSRILESDYEVTTTHTAEQGLEQAAGGRFALILLDVIMPGMDGFTVLKRLQDQDETRHIPVILITSLADIEHEQKGLTLGAVDYIVKPFHPQIVKARVNTHIKLYQYRKQVEDQSMTDQLTGVANRRGHDRYTEVKWSEAIRLGVPMSICMFDIDKFKVYNDTFGHPAGDKVIAAVAGAASSHLRRSVDFFARYGGEEFVAVLMGEGSQKAFEYLKTIRRAIEALQIPHNPEVSPWVTVSIGGVTVCPRWEDSYAAYLQLADTMLYDAKRMGRNRVVWMDENMRQLVEE